jgi:hypothetical protein
MEWNVIMASRTSKIKLVIFIRELCLQSSIIHISPSKYNPEFTTTCPEAAEFNINRVFDNA